MWKNKNIAEKVLARPSEWTGVKEEKKRRRGPYPLLQLCLGALLIFAAVVPENHLYRESSGQQTAQDPYGVISNQCILVGWHTLY